MSFPPLPIEYEDPYFAKRQAFDEAVRDTLTGRLSPSGVTAAVSNVVGPVVEDLVTQALADDSTIVAAAVAAVDDEIAGRPLIEGGPIMEPEIIFAIVDKDGRRTVLELGPDGRLTDRAMGIIAQNLIAPVSDEIGLTSQDERASGLAFAVVDQDGRRTEIEVGPDGKFTDRVVQSLAGRMNVQLTTPLDPGPNALLVGHSMLAGAASAISTAFGSMGRSTTNISVGGESMQTISGRLGSHPTRLTFLDGAIPASGPTNVSVNSDANTPFGQGPQSYAAKVILADGTKLAGTFAKVGGDLVFTRAASGAAISAPRPLAMTYDLAEDHRSDIFVFWAARNGSWTNTNAVRERLDRMEGMIRHQRSLNQRFLVLSEHIAQGTTDGTLTGDTQPVADAIADYNRQAYLRWGGNFIDSQAYLIAYGLADRGMTPTEQDIVDIAANRIPRSLRGDALHLNTDGSAVIADLIKKRILEKGW